jgi:hypothetical protein
VVVVDASGHPGLGDIGRALVVSRAELGVEINLDPRKFPNHPTTNQFMSAELFDAYRALGWAVGGELDKKLHLHRHDFDERPAMPAAATSAPPDDQ